MSSEFDFLGSSGTGRYEVHGIHHSGNVKVRTDNFFVALIWAGVLKEETFNVYIYEPRSFKGRTPIHNWEIEEKKAREKTAFLDCSAKGLTPKRKA